MEKGHPKVSQKVIFYVNGISYIGYYHESINAFASVINNEEEWFDADEIEGWYPFVS